MFSVNTKILFFLLFPVIAFSATVTVDTQSGTVIGTRMDFKGKTLKTFLGIPFAKPPVGKLRFKKTESVEPWSEPMVADTFPPSCYQRYPFDYPWVDKMSNHSEDCLYLNIWAPESASKEDPKAVMFWIHGGGFSTGSNRLPVYHGGTLAAEGDVIVVTINYRVGIFGFLSTDSEEAPGNMGLFDVLEALKWINVNIQEFGGDKNRITVFGQSGGAVISGYLTISPLSAGLFQRIILESGSPAHLQGNPKLQNLELAQKVAAAVGCILPIVTNPQAAVECLRKIPADDLITKSRSFRASALQTFSPIYNDEFLPVEPIRAIQSGNFRQVDVLGGNVNDEGSVLFVSTAPQLCGPYGELHPKISRTLGRGLIYQMFLMFPFKHDVANYYLSGLSEIDFIPVRNQVYHSIGDFQSVCPIIYLVERFENAYYYYFEYLNPKTIYEPWMGVTHFTEVPFVFGRPMENPSNYTKGEVELSRTLVDLWSSFAKSGVPSSGWKKYSRSDPEPYVQRFSVQKSDENYFRHHRKNCDFFRPYFGFL